MRNFLLKSVFLFSITLFSSCGDSGKLDIDGDPEAIEMAENMIKALGGKKAWAKVKSVYVRTIATVSTSMGSGIIEEWTNLDEPKFINKRIIDDRTIFQIIDHNDGWTVSGKNKTMISPGNVTGYLDWHDHYVLVNLKRLATEQENITVKLKDVKQFDLYVDGIINCGFELDEENKIRKYTSYLSNKNTGSIYIRKYREYEGYVFPLEIALESAMSIYKTDYFDPSPLTAEKAFNISFNPEELMNQ